MRQDRVETATNSDRHTAAEKSRALAVLRGSVVLVRHPYQRDPYSGAGNCWCGRHARSSLHSVVLEPTAQAHSEQDHA